MRQKQESENEIAKNPSTHSQNGISQIMDAVYPFDDKRKLYALLS